MSYCRIGRLGNSSITFSKPRNVFGINGGPHPSGFRFIGTADYRGTKTLKSCHREFRLIPPVRLLIKSRLANRYPLLQSAFIFYSAFNQLGSRLLRCNLLKRVISQNIYRWVGKNIVGSCSCCFLKSGRSHLVGDTP